MEGPEHADCPPCQHSLGRAVFCATCRQTWAQEQSLEQRQPLELVFADSIVPQDRHEAMFTTGLWYFRRGSANHGSLTQKVEWGISDRLQVSMFGELLNSSNELGPRKTGIGDFEIGARYSWARVGSEFTHVPGSD